MHTNVQSCTRTGHRLFLPLATVDQRHQMIPASGALSQQSRPVAVNQACLGLLRLGLPLRLWLVVG